MTEQDCIYANKEYNCKFKQHITSVAFLIVDALL